MRRDFMTPMIFEANTARSQKLAKVIEKRNPRDKENWIKTPVVWQRSSLNNKGMIPDQPTLLEAVQLELQYPQVSLVTK